MSHRSDNKPTLRRDGFTFKQFFVAHDRCAMKVGTDGILLGAWAPIVGARRILDIGCGSGLIALMLAQRTDNEVYIDAVEREMAASQQAADNITASAWAHRMRVYAGDIVDFTASVEHVYSLIVSNPPYFAPGVACANESRAQARYTTSLTHDVLLDCARLALAPGGLFCVVLPVQVEDAFLPLAQPRGWFVRQRMAISESNSRPAHRVLLALSRQPGECLTQQLAIRDNDKSYSSDFQRLTKDFYLFM
ncbi:tRNA(1)(Val) (adenine(37)-N(6))-methyltransferase TrmN [Brenneria izbisi]|uniref:tRNA1(Val) (adenine(37)-N6)-methyltransferase n=1 Tax=Brenneria izbisi TaxID=2939450 RepID=A0AA41XZL0_9GAMM|nr:tRNA1(Val) (adenine(37)-N6)-methyltransferase [Brenneria izbisi]MCV9880230.1 tRNA1(Val) (adenine(37)-N6)-methyltransferase [Brenneria izbisi]MCV9883664.1 tRNA1(Val) (adenine(37)-N6)-methyltransferase [Brenneria izbisi]